MMLRIAWVAALLALSAGTVLAQDARPQPPGPGAAGSGPAGSVVPYCIEPMEAMPARIVALINPEFLCAAGTHLKRDSRPTQVVPTGEESSGRPFVLRFGPPESANAWYVRGFAVGQ